MTLEQLVTDRRTARPAFPRPQRARVTRTVAPSSVYVALDALPDVEHGPCAWQQPPAAGTAPRPLPPAGTACLVYFAGDGIADPWLVTFDRWPA